MSNQGLCWVRLLFLAGALALFTSGCGPVSSGTAVAQTDPQAAPAFSGPWAAEFTTYYAMATSKTVRQVFKDEKITDAEWAEVKSRFEACMLDRGIPLTWDDDFGGFALAKNTKGDVLVEDAVKTCGEPFDLISLMRYATARNPTHLDESEIVSACFIKAGIVDPGYTAKQYNTDLQTDPMPAWLDSDRTTSCIRDPLGLMQ